MVGIPDAELKEMLIEDGIIDAEGFERRRETATRMKQSVASVLVSENILTEEYYENLLAHYFAVPRANLAVAAVKENLLRLIPEDVARERRIILFNEDSPTGAIHAAMEDPSDLLTIEFLRSKLGREIRPFLATRADINKGLALFGKRLSEDFKRIIEENVSLSLSSGGKKEEREAALDVPVVAIVDNILAYAISLLASDIHLEMIEEALLIRYRIDGVLHEIMRIPKEVHPAIVARIKLLAALKLDEHQKPQDGRFRQGSKENAIDVRVSIIPTFFGEKVELRLLSDTARPLSLEELGFLPDTAELLRKNINRTYGLILVSGPTGSGKTTTLYSVLNILNTPEVNIATVEDPIEYNMKYINQTQVNSAAGITFASGLRSLLRQDPNIIMIGEIRDNETAEIAIDAALTGHRVFSTIHTNDALTAVPRLIDMGVEPFLVAAVTNAVLAQRLVRRICIDCIASYTPAPEIIAGIREEMRKLGIEKKFVPPKLLFKGAGCKVCNESGYRGRLGIFELAECGEEMKKAIVSPHFELATLYAIAAREGMITMFEDGLRKALRGMTTIEEVLRVIRE